MEVWLMTLGEVVKCEVRWQVRREAGKGGGKKKITKRTNGKTEMKEEKNRCLQCARQLPGSEGSVDRAGEGRGVSDSWQGVNLVPGRCLVATQKTTAAAEDKWRRRRQVSGRQRPELSF